MAFPSTVVSDLVSGIPGEISFDAPYTGIAAVINSASAANNVFGRAMTYINEAVETIGAGGTGKFAGILVNPKTSAFGVIGDTSDTVPNGTPVSTMFEGECYVLLSTGTTVTIGDAVFFVNATGELGVGTAGAGQTQIVGAQVFRHNVSVETPLLATIRIKA
jgi:hypothetical protein